ncbi:MULTISPECIES: thiol-disulfide oxidoreductase DCC family protein [Methylorubrum]|uniref:thiol-disulfide oxidoreductase DCC family protein n=1 Tax=Methylorubrum TaxID=2282523 RepID=UPI00209E58A0|nr:MULTISPECIES: DCC1-like thiol-disulfide oxidoreductase family protein [Methylorubrum]MCP1548365.1 putative DCC family thiol-disulfide oxidoreductase YuxK [Methylorubrum zatmanii]MCP1555020.1 putative DCC family thiol-disulfide oxidoreductase YuxK [Methylorubrum extorquens]MCP1578668.1 putative DCC family thiol-disulfide oxidoreductase YuxK [Methylorubrum extorquens]
MPPTLVFDTDCVLCAGMLRFVLAHERDQSLHFMGAWSGEGLDLVARHGFTEADLNGTFLLIQDGRALTRSDAALAVAGHLKAPWRWCRVFGIVPKPLRDRLYGLVARYRYRWFGRREDCARVPPDQRHRFHGVRPADPPQPE